MSQLIDDIIAREESGFPCIGPMPAPCKRLMHEVEDYYLPAVQAETEAKHEAVNALRRVVSGEETDELSQLVTGILSKHEAAQ